MTGAIPIGQFYPTLSMEENETLVIRRLREQDEATFEQVFKAHYKSLHAYACTIVRDDATAEEMVQNVFFRLWERVAGLTITAPLRAYLFRAVHNESLNYLKHARVRTAHQLHIAHRSEQFGDEAPRRIQHRELTEKLHEALNELPEQCRTIFQLSRFEELRYREIADRLDISVKTVENQMGKALRLLRSKLVDFLPLILFLIELKRNA